MLSVTGAAVTESTDEPLIIVGWPIVAVVAVVAAAVVAWWLVKNRGFQSLSLRAGPVEFDLQAVKRIEEKLDSHGETLAAIDHAVNQTGPNDPTIRETVESHSGEIAAIRNELVTGFAALHTRLDQMAAAAARHHPEDS